MPMRLRRSLLAVASMLLAVLASGCGGEDDAASNAANCAEKSSTCLSVDGFGPAQWDTPIAEVEQTLGVSFDCRGGAVPGTCACVPLTRTSPLTLVFSGPDRVLKAAFLGSAEELHPERVRTVENVGIEDPAAAVVEAYPGAALHLASGLTSGLSDFYLVRQRGHALAFAIIDGKVSDIVAFADGGPEAIRSELCA